MLRLLFTCVIVASPLFVAAATPADPATYPDPEGLRTRADQVITALATHDLSQWRRGYFAGGDPGKFLPGAAMAKWMKNPADPDVAKYLNDDRSYKEHYHFAAVNWARMLPILGADVLTDDTRVKLRQEAKRYSAYLNPEGTENHRTMWMTTANVLPHQLDTGLANQSKEATLRKAKEMLREYVKGLYAAGQGEWDSSIYVMFDVNGMLNIYDYSPDPECQILARAALDWLVATYALKYRSGIYTSPNQRGHVLTPFTSIADRTGYIWFGDATKPPERMMESLYTIHPITSKWRPSRPLYNLATKKLPVLPAEFLNTKPNYWYGQQLTPKPGEYTESFYIAQHYSMGSLWNGFGGQITRFQIVANSPNGAVTFTGGHPRRSDHTTKKIVEFGYADGLGRYDQSAQIGGTFINLTDAPEDETIDYAFFKMPAGTEPKQAGEWQVIRVGETFLGVRGVGADPTMAQTELSDKQQEDNQKAIAGGKPPKHATSPILKFAGRRVGFIVETADTGTYASEDAFRAALAKTKLEANDFAAALKCRYTNIAGRQIDVQYQQDKRIAGVTVDAKPYDPTTWVDIYNGPYLHQSRGVLTVNDGTEGYVVDFTGDLPVYREWKKN